MSAELLTKCEHRAGDLATAAAAVAEDFELFVCDAITLDRARTTSAKLLALSRRLAAMSADAAELAGALSMLANVSTEAKPERKGKPRAR